MLFEITHFRYKFGNRVTFQHFFNKIYITKFPRFRPRHTICVVLTTNPHLARYEYYGKVTRLTRYIKSAICIVDKVI